MGDAAGKDVGMPTDQYSSSQKLPPRERPSLVAPSSMKLAVPLSPSILREDAGEAAMMAVVCTLMISTEGVLYIFFMSLGVLIVNYFMITFLPFLPCKRPSAERMM